MKKKVIILILTIIIGIICYVSAKHLLSVNNEWLTFISALVSVIYLFVFTLWFKDDVVCKFRSINRNCFGEQYDDFINKVFEIRWKLKETKFVTYIRGNERLNFISDLCMIFTVLPSLIVALISVICPTFFQQHKILYLIGILLMFLSAILSLIQAIVCSSIPKKSRMPIVMTFILIFSGIVFLLEYFSY